MEETAREAHEIIFEVDGPGIRIEAFGPSTHATSSTPTREIRWISTEPFSDWTIFASLFSQKQEARCSSSPRSAAR